MRNTSVYGTAIGRTIEKIFYHKKQTPAEQKTEKELLRSGWIEEEKELWFHDISPDLGDIYASLQKVAEEIKNKEIFERIGKIREEGNSAGRKYPIC